MIEYLGWTATAVFVCSYFSRRASTLRLMQIAGALLWIVYGLLIQAAPVMVANLLVIAAAAITMWRTRASRESIAQAQDAV